MLRQLMVLGEGNQAPCQFGPIPEATEPAVSSQLFILTF